ncbi:Glycosyltransferase involved in cell wall bisynthesis [Aquimarina amphilecti]|uniref:Glycosyltransferase involved in cell wall bisynthesis n=1 Tax=Aquimarina amphilecti TaxID=1038014 RepID=A0A1H7JSU9_AQUAM|nr:glycosyltransferase family 4 protein [Aquimarina amphilecti]SEK77406.1 Glycosyltransferase involved in cell wall bisynthesis [Aquimarina amphilecti]
MKVLIVNTLYEPYKVGGAEISVQSIAEGMVKNGIEVAVLTLGEKTEKTIINNVLVYRLKIENLFWPFNEINYSKIKKLKWHFSDIHNKKYDKNIDKIIDEFCPNVIHTNNLTGFSVAIWDIAKRRQIKIIHTLRDYYLQCPKTNKFKNDNCEKQCAECLFFSIMKKAKSQLVDSVVGISNFILEDHIDKGYFKYALKKVIYNGFDTKKEILSNSDFEKHTFLKFGFIGQINKAKGIEVLIRSLEELKDYDNWKLFIAGNVDPSYKDYLLSFLPDEKVEFMGYMKQDTFFDIINVLIVPSLWEEPFGRVVLEGLLSNVPVLGSKKGGIKEILTGNSKFTFNPFKEDLKSLLQSILENPEELNTFNIDINDFHKLYSLECMIDAYVKTYKELKK